MLYDTYIDKSLNDFDRMRAVNASGLLDSPPDKIFDEATSDICRKLRVPISLVTIVTANRQFFKSCIGLPEEAAAKRETPVEDSVCRYVVGQGTLVVIEDVRNDPYFCRHDGLNKINGGSYLGTPLMLYNQVIGSVCAVDTKPRQWTESEIVFLEARAYLLTTRVTKRPALL